MEPATSACPQDVRQAAYTLDMFQTSQVFGWKKGSWRVSRAVCKWSGAEVLLQMFGKDYMEKHSDLQRAAQAVRTLSHPHLLTVYAVFQDGNQTVLVYELPIKGPLDHEVDQLNKKVSERQVVRKVLYPVISAAMRLREPGLELSYVCPQDVWCLEGGRFKLIVPMTCQHVPQGPAAAALAQEFTAPELQRKIMIDADTTIDPGRALTYSLTVLAHYCLLGATPKNGKPSNGTISGASSDFGSDVVGDLPIRRHQPSVMTLLGLQKSGPRREKHDHHDLPLWMSDEAANFMLVGLLKDSCDRPTFQALLEHPWIHSNLPADALEEAADATRNLSREGWRRTAPVLPMKVSQPSSQQLNDMMASVQADSLNHQQQQQQASAAKSWSGWADPHAPPEVPPLPHIRVRTPLGSESRPGSAGRPLSGRPLSAAGPAGGKNGAVAALKSMHTMRVVERVEKRTVLEEPEADGQGAVTVTEETQVMGEVLQPGGNLAGLKQAAHSVLRANITTARPRTDHGTHWSSAVHAKTFDDIPAKQLPLAPPLESVLAGDYIDYEMEDDDSDDGVPGARKSLYGGGKSFKSMKSMKSFKSFKRPTITGEKTARGDGERLTPPRTARPSATGGGGLTPPRMSRTGDVERVTPPRRARTPPATSA